MSAPAPPVHGGAAHREDCRPRSERHPSPWVTKHHKPDILWVGIAWHVSMGWRTQRFNHVHLVRKAGPGFRRCAQRHLLHAQVRHTGPALGPTRHPSRPAAGIHHRPDRRAGLRPPDTGAGRWRDALSEAAAGRASAGLGPLALRASQHHPGRPGWHHVRQPLRHPRFPLVRQGTESRRADQATRSDADGASPHQSGSTGHPAGGVMLRQHVRRRCRPGAFHAQHAPPAAFL